MVKTMKNILKRIANYPAERVIELYSQIFEDKSKKGKEVYH